MYEDSELKRFERLDKTDLKFYLGEDGSEAILKGQARGHEVVLTCVGFNPKNLDEGEFKAEIDSYEPLTGKTARTLFHRYYDIYEYKKPKIEKLSDQNQSPQR